MSNKKHPFIARLAAERARLLRSMIGLDEAALTTIHPGSPFWSARNYLILAHQRDSLYSELIYHACEVHDLDTWEARVYSVNEQVARTKDWSLDDTMSLLDAGRSGLHIAFVDWVTHYDEKFTYRVDWGNGIQGEKQESVRDWLKASWDADESFTSGMNRWRETLPDTFGVGPKSVLLAALYAATYDMQESALLVPVEEWETRPICGVWTVRDVYGHLADWDVFFLHVVETMLGEPTQDLDWDDDEHMINTRLHEKRRGQPAGQAWDDCKRARTRLLDKLHKITQDDLVKPRGYPYPDVYHAFWSALEHSLDHAATLRRELPTVDFPKRLREFSGPYT